MRTIAKRTSLTRTALTISVTAATFAVGACGESRSPILPSPAPTGASISIVAGNNQAGTSSSSTALGISAKDSSGSPQKSVVVLPST